MTDTGRFRPDIQGLRAVAVGAVVLNHAGIPFVSGGYVGVDVFFVISGFLISSHLLEGLEDEGRIRFATFYARRARRILPASLVVVLASLVGAMIWVPPLLRTQVLNDAIATALYVPNYAFAVQGTDYLAQSTTPSLFQHYWSLGVEEQFYLIWPALLAGVWLAGRSRRALAIVLGVVVVSSLLCSVTLTFQEQPWAFFSLWSRAWELGIGGLVALVLRARPRIMPPIVAGIAGWLGLTGILGAVALFTNHTAFPGWAAIVPVSATALVIAVGGAQTRFGPIRLLGTWPFQFVGAISYSLYLVHWPILQLAQAAAGYYHVLSHWETVALVIMSIPIAWLLYRFVETPGRTVRWFALGPPRRTLALAGIGSVAIVGLTLGAIALTAIEPLNVGAAAVASAPTDPPQVTATVAPNVKPSLRGAADDNPSLYAAGCEVGYTPSVPHPCTDGSGGAHVVLFGDSHAAEWYPALKAITAKGNDTLTTQTKSACPSIDVDLKWAGVTYVACEKWRDSVISQLRAAPPDLVVLSNYTNPDFADSADEAGQWQRGMEKTIRQLSSFTRVVVIADTPDMRDNPSVCLSGNLSNTDACAQPASLALKAPGRAATLAAAKATNTPIIDLTGYFCTSECAPIIGDVLVYRDSHHITATFSRSLTPVLSARLVPLLHGK